MGNGGGVGAGGPCPVLLLLLWSVADLPAWLAWDER